MVLEWNCALAPLAITAGALAVLCGERRAGMGKGRAGKGDGAKAAVKATDKGSDDDDALLDAAIAEKRVLQERAAKKAAADAATTAAAASAIAAALDKLPVFTVADSEGKPLQFTVGKRQLAVFYADVAAAKAQRLSVVKQHPDCDLIAVGLGNAYRLSYEGKAMLVPDVAELRAAGAPADAQPIGQELPLFMCPKLSRYDGTTAVTPLFMSHADCAAAAAESTSADAPDDGVPSAIRAITLQSVVNELSDPAAPVFSFVAPSASRQHVEQYQGKGVYMRVIEESGESQPAAADDDVPPLQ